MKKNKGQALIEFVMILPVFIAILFSIIDIGRVISTKNELENKVSDVSNLYENGKTIDEITNIINDNDINIDVMVNDDYTTITLKKTINSITPGLDYISSDIFNISTYRVIKNE